LVRALCELGEDGAEDDESGARGAAVGAAAVGGKTAFKAEQPIRAVRRTIETERVNFFCMAYSI
jgi:hypothetical protein